MRHVLEIPRWHPAKTNQLYRGHWSEKRKLKQFDKLIVSLLAKEQRIPSASGKRRVTLVVVLPPKARGGDVDAYAKSLLDALTHARLLVDDRKEYAELAPVQYERGTAFEWGSRILLEDL